MARPQSRHHSRSHHQEEVLKAPPGSPTPWSTEQNSNLEFFSPRPPSRPAGDDGSGRRKTSARGRPSLVTSGPGPSLPQLPGEIDPFARRPSRPSSSLSKYKPLPDIQHGHHKPQGLHDNLDYNVENINISSDQQLHTRFKVKQTKSSEKRVKSSENRVTQTSSEIPVSKVKISVKRKTTVQKSDVSKSSEHKNVIPDPSQDNPVIEIGVKLPDTGDRVCQVFHSFDTLKSVMKFAQNKTGSKKLSQKYSLAINMPRKVFTNLSITIKEAGLDNKTILYLIEKDLD
ncbi:hypothetical protein LOTGIDRAFT_234065 [Lottia gigantea]|uniref:UBX domain-containing protein n=1 Tax=Lottia gigantea TaxID=225164 RepID=V4BM50_LOTGI|nr:hypothetical protein LOTGIDRAFT_234065 [Lottia gigantea]ESO89954.1 hypothetical protein LOTGIDRAFT_234065 [Lottia gigantea]